MKKSKYTTVSLPKPLYGKVKELIEDTGFTSVSDFVTYVLREVVAEEKSAKRKGDKEKVKSRLRALGYID